MNVVPNYAHKARIAEKLALKQRREELKKAADALTFEEATNKLEENIEYRRSLRQRLIDVIRQNENFYKTEKANLRRKMNCYPTEIGDTRLVAIARNLK